MTELRERLESTIGDRNNRLIADILLALADGPTEVEALSREIEAPPRIIEEALDELAEDGVVTRDGRQYRLAE
jgi:ArsR family transcriptional regulator